MFPHVFVYVCGYTTLYLGTNQQCSSNSHVFPMSVRVQWVLLLCMYLSNPLSQQDVAQDQFLSEVIVGLN